MGQSHLQTCARFLKTSQTCSKPVYLYPKPLLLGAGWAVSKKTCLIIIHSFMGQSYNNL